MQKFVGVLVWRSLVCHASSTLMTIVAIFGNYSSHWSPGNGDKLLLLSATATTTSVDVDEASERTKSCLCTLLTKSVVASFYFIGTTYQA